MFSYQAVGRLNEQLFLAGRGIIMIEIKQASTENEFDSVRHLTRTFVDWLRQNFPDTEDMIDQYFNALVAEMASLPCEFTPPTGTLLIAYCDGEVVGTVSMRNISNQTCEMKHMFVLSKFHGKGIGRALASELINQSRKMGYECMRLDTSLGQVAAQGLYCSLGFQEIPPYYELPESVRTNMVFMELRL
jgi:ribosomal protein S18 acetylase RimI-like enzyme